MAKIDKIFYFSKNLVNKFDIFELGNSFILWYLFIFLILPIGLFLSDLLPLVSYKNDLPHFEAKTFFYLFIGLFSFIIGYYFCFLRLSSKKKFLNFFKKEWDYKRSIYVFIVVFIIDFSVKFIKIVYGGYFHIKRSQAFMTSQFYSLIGLLEWLGPVVLTLAFVNYFNFLKIGNKNYIKWKWIAWSLFIFEFLYGLFSLSRFSALVPVLVYLITRHYLFKRDYIKIFFIIAAFLAVILPLVSFIRNPGNFYSIDRVAENKDQNVSVSNIGEFVSDSIAKRVGHPAIIIQNIFIKTNDFLYGKIFKDFFISLGPPRFIWKNKPSISSSGNEFGRKIGVLDSKDFTTSVGPTFVGDWYMNFGLGGIIFGMFFIGIIFRFIYDLFIRYSEHSSSGIMFYVVAWIQLIKGSEDFIAPIWAGLIKLFVILTIMHYFLINRKEA